MKKRSLSRILGGAVALTLAASILAGPAGADSNASATSISSAPPQATALRGLRGVFSILKSRSFVGSDGHVYTTADLNVDGSIVRGVTAPGGRVGNRWEFVESLPVIDLAGQDHEEPGHVDEGGPTGAEAFQMQSGEAAGTSLFADATTATANAAPATFTTMYGYGWCSGRLDAPYRVNTAGAPGGAVDAIRAGFNAWTNHSSSWMSFAYKGTTSVASPTRDGVNSVYFKSSPEAFLGRTWVYGEGNHVVGFDIQLNRRYALTVGGSGFDLQTLMAHEAGHAAGFGHTSNASNLMYGGGQAPRSYKRSLGSTDIAGLNSLYPYGKFSAALISKTGPATLAAGKVGTYTATFENRGRTPWGGTRFAPVRLRTSNNLNSPFADGSWYDPKVPAYSQASICQGDRVTLTWKMKAPGSQMLYKPAFVPVVGSYSGTRWLTGSIVNLSINVGGTSSGGGGDDGGDGDDGGCFLFFCW